MISENRYSSSKGVIHFLNAYITYPHFSQTQSDEFGLTVSMFAEIVLFNFMSLGSFDSIFDVKLQMDFQ